LKTTSDGKTFYELELHLWYLSTRALILKMFCRR